MWKYLAALLVVLFSMGGLVAAQTQCGDLCYANVITQIDTQRIHDVMLGQGDGVTETVAVGNEGLSAAIIVTKAPEQPTAGDMFIPAPFARIDQRMDQTVSNLGSTKVVAGFNVTAGAVGITWNKAIQAAWIANQGVKEWENTSGEYKKEGAWISQSTTQITNNVYDYDMREGAKVLNVDNKLAMIVDDMNATINLIANADSTSSDSQKSEGTIINDVNVTIAGKDP